ncbi:MAG: riboflavin synthase [Deltaproteobacteria bacterium]|nr:riboflavin synthase [Deltaproteobacteria bacterium]MBW2577079.1 riboflavin synthase [Deltaproteobacteria bacterium]MBW2691855.1 riboflavin synthase [Deltaproteobacteria bacterium]
MFTGIVETVGIIEKVEPGDDLTRLVVGAESIAEGVKLGDSIAVNGGCLTVTSLLDGRFAFEAIPETMERTNLGDLKVGSRVNLERAMRAGDRLDGHIVQGHVDGVGTVRAVIQDGNDVRLQVDCDPELADCVVEKGSIAIDGVSLTVSALLPSGFEVALIPHTLEVTTLSDRQIHDRVNLEADVLGKYVKRYLERMLPPNDEASR